MISPSSVSESGAMVRRGREGVLVVSGVGVRGGVVMTGSGWVRVEGGSTSVMVEAPNSAWAETTSMVSLKTLTGDDML